MGESVATARVRAIEDFAAVLSELRDGVGSPSFRTMAGRSGAISHTTLHEAVKGYRLPSWGTTAEFVKACGSDPAEYRERWERASRAVSGGGPTPDPSGTTPLPAAAVPARAPVEPAALAADDAPVDGDRHWSRRRGWVAALCGGLVLLAAVGTAAVIGPWWTRDRVSPDAEAIRQVPSLSPADCPHLQSNPLPAPAAHPGDGARFVGDLTLPDCTHVRRGDTVRKVWRLKNVGTVTWNGYLLRRMDPQGVRDCQTITDVPVPRTEPGKVVDLPVEVLVPHVPGFCFVRFTLMDGEGHRAFPGGRPVNFQLIVD